VRDLRQSNQLSSTSTGSRVNRIILATIAAALLATASSVSAQTNETHTYSLGAQDALTGLQALAIQGNFQVFFTSDLVKGRKIQAVHGSFTAEDALSKALEGTGLTYRVTPEGTYIVEKGAQTSASMEAAPTESGVELHEIIVTATKRAASIQDVPLSITALTADEIDRRGLVGAEDYLRGIPGVNQATDFGGSSIVIRGLETSPNAQNGNSGTTVATYFGETPTTNTAGLTGNTNVDIKLVDIERVEVLRGPQGTSFGSSSLGGAVRTIPVAPNLQSFSAKVGASYSATSGTGGGNHMVQAVGNFPLVQDRLALRATAYQFQDSGFYRNRAGSDPAFQAAMASYGAQAFATDAEEVGDADFTGGRIAALFRATDNLRFTLTWLTQKTKFDGQARSGTGVYEQTLLQVAREHVLRGERGGVFDTDIDLANGVMEYDFGWADLLATVSHIESGTTWAMPMPTFPLRPWSQLAPSEHRETSGEIRLATRLEGAWNFLGGFYAEELDDRGRSNFIWYGDPAANNTCPACAGQLFIGETRNVNNMKQKAAFAEASWELLRDFTLTGGVRAYDYERTNQSDSSGPIFVVGGGTSPTTTLNGDASGTSFRGNLSYKLHDNALVYAGWSQGFRLGRPQVGLVPGLCDRDGDGVVDGTSTSIEATRFVESDEVDNFELGTKLTLMDNRLVIAADVYRIDWDGVPVRTAAPVAPLGCGSSYVANAGGAISEGVELQTNFQVTPALRVDLGGSRVNARLSKDAPALGAASGTRLPGSPRLNANFSMQYEFALGGYEAVVRADSIYVGSFYGDLLGNPATRAGDYVKVDASVRVTLRDLNVDLFVRNLTDADDFTFRGTVARQEFYGYRLRPRTIGLQLGYTY
jgi:iron complex outermembrane recepter protein